MSTSVQDKWKPVVITVGMVDLPLHRQLAPRLKRLGVEIFDLETYEDLPRTLRDHHKAAVIVYSRHRRAGAQHVLTQTMNLCRLTPVVVLVEHSDFAEYQELMADGAVCYYELAEGPERICQAVEQVAVRNAA